MWQQNTAYLDADAGAADNQAFAFTGTAALSGGAGELRYGGASGKTVVYTDVDGDKAADFVITLMGVTGLVAADFVL